MRSTTSYIQFADIEAALIVSTAILHHKEISRQVNAGNIQLNAAEICGAAKGNNRPVGQALDEEVIKTTFND